MDTQRVLADISSNSENSRLAPAESTVSSMVQPQLQDRGELDV
jgi:hypothetical protein